MKIRILKSVVCLGLLAFFALSIQGCSISRALSGPDPVAVERVKTGESRNTIISVLGIPKNTENKVDAKVDMYEFTDGYSSGSKVRVILYLAGDVFTLGLSELLFWPIELAAGDGTKGRALVTYGLDDIAKNVLLTKADGSPWQYGNTEPTPVVQPQPKSTNKVNPETGAIIQ